jgi:hypothetical protein
MDRYRVLEGLPPYGPRARPFPPEWGRLGREGLVVEFMPSQSDRWTANFQPGLAGLDEVIVHPDRHHVLVFSSGDLWSVDPELREAVRLAFAIDARWDVSDGRILSKQGLAFLNVGPSGVVWHTRRLSWDGFSDVENGQGWQSGAPTRCMSCDLP